MLLRQSCLTKHKKMVKQKETLLLPKIVKIKIEANHLIEVSLNIAFLQVNLLISLDDLLQPLLSLLTLLELKEKLACHFFHRGLLRSSSLICFTLILKSQTGHMTSHYRAL